MPATACPAQGRVRVVTDGWVAHGCNRPTAERALQEKITRPEGARAGQGTVTGEGSETGTQEGIGLVGFPAEQTAEGSADVFGLISAGAFASGRP